MGSLELRSRPATYVTKSERNARRPADPHVAMHYDSVRVRPLFEEVVDSSCVLRRKKNVRWLAALGDVVELEPQYGCELRRNFGGLRLGIRDGDADLSQTRLVKLCVFARQHNQLRNLPSCHWRTTSSRLPRHLLAFRGWPRSEQQSDGDDLREMVGRVIDGNENSSQVSLSGPAGNSCRQIEITIGSEALQRLAIFLPDRDARVPFFVARGRRVGRPVVPGPLQLFLVVRILNEIQQVPLSNSDMLQEIPHGVREAGWLLCAQLGRQTLERVLQ